MIKEIKDRKINLSVGTAVSISLFMVAVIYASTVRISKIENTIANCYEQIQKNTKDIAENRNNQRQIDISNAEIKTKLVSIEATLLEIKQTLALDKKYK